MLTGNQKRRAFLKNSAVITAGTLLLPSFLKASNGFNTNGKRLVVIQLSGGNDGLNTIIPYRNDDLLKVRPTLLSSQAELLKITDELAFNAGMKDFRELYDDGDVCILNQVGYPNPNRSHFRSMDIWQSASNSDEYIDSGWLGRYLDSECPPNHAVTAIEVGNILSLAMKGKKFKGIPVTDIRQFYDSARRIQNDAGDHVDNPVASFLHKTINDTRNTSQYLFEKIKTYQTKVTYPTNELGLSLKQVARLILSGVEAPIYYVSLGGFDTHNNQQNRQQRLLEMYSSSVLAFINELKGANEWKNTTIMTFSEFGRRVTQNASGGTDHGKANNLFIMSGGLKKNGLYNGLYNLQKLDDGDLQHEIDFRQVYATLLNKWLGTDASNVLGTEYTPLPFI